MRVEIFLLSMFSILKIHFRFMPCAPVPLWGTNPICLLHYGDLGNIKLQCLRSHFFGVLQRLNCTEELVLVFHWLIIWSIVKDKDHSWEVFYFCFYFSLYCIFQSISMACLDKQKTFVLIFYFINLKICIPNIWHFCCDVLTTACLFDCGISYQSKVSRELDNISES